MPKSLGEFLEEQQEPFALENYLVERGVFRNGAQTLKGPAAKCTEFAKAVFSRLILHFNHDKEKKKNHGNGSPKDITNNRKSTQDKYAVFDSCHEKKVDADRRKLKWRSMEDGSNIKQLSPVSENNLSCITKGSLTVSQSIKTTKRESSTSISQCKSKHPTYINSVGMNSYDQHIVNKRALHQTKQLLIDCVREVIEKHRKVDDKKGQQLLGAEELWKLVCENVWLWSQHSMHETNTLHLLNYDNFMACQQEWTSRSQLQKQEISQEIGDDILDGIISDFLTS